MSIDTREIDLQLPDGLVKASKFKVKGRTVEVMLKATKEVSGAVVSATYDEGAPVSAPAITGVPAVEFQNLELTGDEFYGETVTVTATFDKAPRLDFYKVKLSGLGLTQKQAPEVHGNTIVSKYTLPKKSVHCIITATYNGKTTKAVNATPKIHSQVFVNLVAEPTSAHVGDTISIIAQYKSPVIESDKPKTYAVAEGTTLTQDWTAQGSTFVSKYSVQTSGQKSYTATAFEGKSNETSRMVTVTING